MSPEWGRVPPSQDGLPMPPGHGCGPVVLGLPQLCRVRERGGSAFPVGVLSRSSEAPTGLGRRLLALTPRPACPMASPSFWVGGTSQASQCTLGAVMAHSRLFPAGLHSGSALFRHEIGYVLGQMQDEACVPQLTAALRSRTESPMVRHECAEALGSIARPSCLETLRAFAHDEERVVRESCEVALDMYEYENGTQFQYADGLCKLQASA